MSDNSSNTNTKNRPLNFNENLKRLFQNQYFTYSFSALLPCVTGILSVFAFLINRGLAFKLLQISSLLVAFHLLSEVFLHPSKNYKVNNRGWKLTLMEFSRSINFNYLMFVVISLRNRYYNFVLPLVIIFVTLYSACYSLKVLFETFSLGFFSKYPAKITSWVDGNMAIWMSTAGKLEFFYVISTVIFVLLFDRRSLFSIFAIVVSYNNLLNMPNSYSKKEAILLKEKIDNFIDRPNMPTFVKKVYFVMCDGINKVLSVLSNLKRKQAQKMYQPPQSSHQNDSADEDDE
eukprot:TRINITY_DN2194_c0_g1_i1.p1 TRINITY_DN2194_c0_g1~~TRINITY_DN2194_c0_g1_i1.p1  ORF type:complete len:302 (+),score=65.79 TRINITY_DN2194_c0_g1_i1:40-906(+)